jgi:hypothetical protein
MMSNPKDLAVDVLHNNEIVVADPNTGFKMTYWRDGTVLVATRWIRGTPSRDEMKFLVSAWKAVYAKAHQLGWMRPANVAA